MLNLYPQNAELIGKLTPDSLFRKSLSNKDFNHDSYTWTYRGAYSGCCTNTGWKLQLDTMPTPKEATSVEDRGEESGLILAPNPVQSVLHISSSLVKCTSITLTTLTGMQVYASECATNETSINMESLPKGLYLLRINGGSPRKILKF